MQRKDETLRSYIERWSVIKNSAEDISDERAIDAFSAGLRRLDLVEEVGRVKPRIVDVYARFYPCRQCWASKCRGL
jgi:hypothetical protein